VKYQLFVGCGVIKPTMYLLVLLSNLPCILCITAMSLALQSFIFFSNFAWGQVLNHSVLLRATESRTAFWFRSFYELFLFKYTLKRSDICGSVHHSTIHRAKSNKMQQCIKIYYSLFTRIWSSTCFGRNTAHRQEPKTALAASGFAFVDDCWTCGFWTLSATNNHTSNNLPRLQNPSLLVQF
jgi:hypothetical protein